MLAKPYKKINYKIFQDRKWAFFTSLRILNVLEGLNKGGTINLMLTGGNTARSVYKHLCLPLIKSKLKINFYLTDERCVGPNNNKSNHYMIKKVLLNFKNSNFNFYRIFGEERNFKKECLRYEKLLSKKIDLVLLSLGKDGHIASLFPKNVTNLKQKVVNIYQKKKIRRYTVTPYFLKKMKKIIVFVKGSEKGVALKKTLLCKKKIFYPARNVIDAEWVLNYSAFKKVSYLLK